MASNRAEKVSDLLKKEISLIITNEIKDPRLQNINITAVKVSDDIGIATVFYSIIGESIHKSDSKIDDRILKKFSGMIRSNLAKKIKIRRIPKIIFRFDESIEYSENIEKALKKFKIMNGFILVDKETGISSNSIVQQVKKKLKVKKVGHLGTLDPLAKGLVILAINRATKFSSYFLESDKSYDVQIKLGIATDTDDSTGTIIHESQNYPESESVKKELLSFIGESMQVPPFFSALKHKGKPLYKYAREGNFISKPSRRIFISKIENFNYKNKICSFRVDCSKGTYIRSIARDIGNKLECGAHMTSLTRISQGNFRLENARKSSDVTKENIICIEDAFKNLDKILINTNDEKKFINGVSLPNLHHKDSLLRVFSKSNIFLGIGEIKGNHLKHKQLV
jgi:tRNA pseudouridine55 synthase